MKGSVGFAFSVLGVLVFALLLSHGCDPGRVLVGPCEGQACSDGNECTSDMCTNGLCSNPPLANGARCDAGGEDGICQDGLCLPASPSVEEGLFAFLAQQQDPTTGLLEGFVRHPDLPPDFLAFLDARPSFTYDNALAALAWLARGEPDDVDRATRLLDALLALQRIDGALPDSANAVSGAPLATSTGTGNQAWAILAFLAASEVTGEERWLLAAERVAAFLLDPAQDSRKSRRLRRPPLGARAYRGLHREQPRRLRRLRAPGRRPAQLRGSAHGGRGPGGRRRCPHLL